MELLFKSENFSETFKALLGFVDADIRFNRVKSSLEIATDEIIDLIGYDTYNAFLKETEPSELHQMAKYAIALNGYMLYAPTADLSVTNNGRLMRRDDHQVSAFEWQIEKNNEALRNLYYRHLDRMLKYMVLNGITINQEKYNHSQLIVSNLAAFETHFNINSSYYLYLKLLPAIREFEQNEMLPRMQSIISNVQQNQNLDYINNLFRNACVNYAMAWGLRRLNIQLFPDGVMQTSKVSNQGENKKRGDKLEHLETAMTFEKNYERTLLKIEGEIANLKPKSEIPDDDLEMDFGFDACSGFVDV